MTSVTVLDDHQCALGEGPIWDPDSETMHWVDIPAGDVHTRGAGKGRSTRSFGESVGAVLPTQNARWLACLATGIVQYDESGSRPIARFPGHEHGGMRANDAAVDPVGRLWVGTMGTDAQPHVGTLYRLHHIGDSLEPVLADVTISNGIGWSPAGDRMYYVDSATQRVDVFDYDTKSGTPSDRRAFAVVPTDMGTPDGLTVDTEGGVWLALWGGGAVVRFDEDANVTARVELPTENVTSCAFAGTELDRLVVTTAASTDRSDDPAAGMTFLVEDNGTHGQRTPGVRVQAA